MADTKVYIILCLFAFTRNSKNTLSFSYFNTLFTARYKMTPIKYVTKLRIDYAKELLITKRYSVTEVAELCGFENVYYFSRVFKEKVGLSPKNFK